MSRNGPMGQLGTKLPPRRPASEDPTTATPVSQPAPRWPQAPQQPMGYGQQGGGQRNYFFPQQPSEPASGHGYQSQPAGYPRSAPAASAPLHQPPFGRPSAADAGHDYSPQASSHGQPLPFSRFPQPAQEPSFGYQQQPQAGEPHFDSFGPAAGHQQDAAASQWGQQADSRGYDMGSYAPAADQGYAPQADPGDFQHQQDAGLFGSPQRGYAETDGEFDDPYGEEEEAPSPRHRGLLIVAALVGAIGLGGGMAYTYKTFFASRSGPAPLVKDTQGPTKSKPQVADGKGFPHTDKKLLNRLGEDSNPPPAAATPASAGGPDERASDDPNAPRRVRIIPINPGEQSPPVVATAPAAAPAAPPAAAAPAPIVTVPGVTLENFGPRPAPVGARVPPQAAPPSAARIDLPPQAAPPANVARHPVKVASAANTPPPAAAPPAAAAPVAKAKPEKAAVPKATRQAAVTTGTPSGGGSGYVAVLSSQKTRMDALKVFADMQQKYGDVLGSKTPDVQEANLGEKGVWYRAVAGPPGSREAALSLCSQLKSAGYTGCWVTAY